MAESGSGGGVYGTEAWAARVREIRDSPDDDTPRLLAADYLEENGESARAEFVRLQVQAARVGRWGGWCCKVCGATPAEDPLDPRLGVVRHGKGCYQYLDIGGGEETLWEESESAEWRALTTRAEATLYTVLAGRLGIVPRWKLWLLGGPGEVEPPRWSRGFAEAVRLPAAAWLAHGDAILAREPVRRVELATRPGFELVPFGRGYRLVGDAASHGRAVADLTPAGIRGELLAARWPGVTFTLPPELTTVTVPGPTVGARRTLDTPALVAISDRLPAWNGTGVITAAAMRFEVAEPLAPGDRAEVGPDGRLRKVG